MYVVQKHPHEANHVGDETTTEEMHLRGFDSLVAGRRAVRNFLKDPDRRSCQDYLHTLL